jgi:1-acyl-sn-glycerol-3-phosphate acyltransferase
MVGPESAKSTDKTSTVVCNHSGWFEILNLVSYIHPSFAAKDSIAGLPIFGPLTRALQCVYIKREGNVNERSGAIGQIIERQT